MLTDHLSDLLFIHSPEARSHLLAERRPPEAIHDVGNTMIDTLVALRDAIAARDAPRRFAARAREYLLVTLIVPRWSTARCSARRSERSASWPRPSR